MNESNSNCNSSDEKTSTITKLDHYPTDQEDSNESKTKEIQNESDEQVIGSPDVQSPIMKELKENVYDIQNVLKQQFNLQINPGSNEDLKCLCDESFKTNQELISHLLNCEQSQKIKQNPFLQWITQQQQNSYENEADNTLVKNEHETENIPNIFSHSASSLAEAIDLSHKKAPLLNEHQQNMLLMFCKEAVENQNNNNINNNLNNNNNAKWNCPECKFICCNKNLLLEHFDSEHKETGSFSCTCGHISEWLPNFLRHYITCRVAATDLQDSQVGQGPVGSSKSDSSNSIEENNNVSNNTGSIKGNNFDIAALSRGLKGNNHEGINKFLASAAASILTGNSNTNQSSAKLPGPPSSTNGWLNTPTSGINSFSGNPLANLLTNCPWCRRGGFTTPMEAGAHISRCNMRPHLHSHQPNAPLPPFPGHPGGIHPHLPHLGHHHTNHLGPNHSGMVTGPHVPPNSNNPLDARHFKCSHCIKSFKSKALLDQHMHIHFPPKYTCRYCGKKYRWPPVFYHHQRTCKKRPPATVVASNSTSTSNNNSNNNSNSNNTNSSNHNSSSHTNQSNNSHRKAPSSQNVMINSNVQNTHFLPKHLPNHHHHHHHQPGPFTPHPYHPNHPSNNNFSCPCTQKFDNFPLYLAHVSYCPIFHHANQPQPNKPNIPFPQLPLPHNGGNKTSNNEPSSFLHPNNFLFRPPSFLSGTNQHNLTNQTNLPALNNDLLPKNNNNNQDILLNNKSPFLFGTDNNQNHLENLNPESLLSKLPTDNAFTRLLTQEFNSSNRLSSSLQAAATALALASANSLNPNITSTSAANIHTPHTNLSSPSNPFLNSLNPQNILPQLLQTQLNQFQTKLPMLTCCCKCGIENNPKNMLKPTIDGKLECLSCSSKKFRWTNTNNNNNSINLHLHNNIKSNSKDSNTSSSPKSHSPIEMITETSPHSSVTSTVITNSLPINSLSVDGLCD